ncbi:MAG: TonB-dependent receptor, partial [Cellvibrionaceae bacterium]|nr:TonB-dependent receptor [Cellvibrionaceae bacterium]
MNRSFKASLIAGAIAAAINTSSVYAQSTFSSIRGKVSDEQGQAQSNVSVSVEDTRTGVVRSYTTNASGSFFASNLPVGGPYKVTVGDREPVLVEYLGLGDIYKLNLSAADVYEEEILVLGTVNAPVDTASGPAATFTSTDLRENLALNRDIKDVYSLDPRLSIDDPSRGGGSLNCAGKHPRFSSVTLDGVSYNDRFGLNDNGYATASGMPFPFDAIENVAVELAPMDVSYSGFSACNINAVTKSGSNEWHGTAFFEWSSDDLRGDSVFIEGEAVDTGDDQAFDERKKGIAFGGPIIKDKLFFFAAYEDTTSPRFIASGHQGSGNGEEREWLSQADFQRIQQIAQEVYDYDPGGQPGNGVLEEQKYMLRSDWSINDQHNASFIYNYYDGTEDRASDSDDNEFEFANHFYVKGSESITYTAKLTSQWSDALSTELYFSTTEMKDSQVTVGPKDFAEMQISVGADNVVYLGADDSRQANSLNTQSDYFKVNAQYLWQDHLFTAGFEREKLEIFNLFVQQSRGGEYRFFNDENAINNPSACDNLSAEQRRDNPDCALTGIDNFELGLASQTYYSSGGGSNIATDAAANFSNTLNSLYIQDEFYYAPASLTLVGGLRYEFFTSDDSPNFNPVFTEANGVRNDANIDGLDILLPRLGATWEAADNLVVRGGIGRFSGGNPNVWISNAWSNDGVTKVDAQDRAGLSLFDIPLGGAGRPGYDVPQQLLDFVGSVTPEDGTNNGVVLLDPNYKQPSEWKYSLGADYFFDNGIKLQGDLLYSELKDSAIYVDLSQSVVGRTRTDQPIYDYTNGTDNLMLTNSQRDADSYTLSLIASKSFDFGLDAMLGYAYTEGEDISSMTSAVAGSNFENN